MVQEANPGIGPEEYLETYYEYERSNEETEEVRSIEEVISESHPLGMIPDHYTTQEYPTDRTRSLEEEVATLRQQLFTAETRAARAEPERDEITREMIELADLLVCHFGI
ncbi:unnamed protein product [Lactuca virosa]|uniref:Uncharacterized protein n=1 Tax=Lactuca virosa TaxID=75947 RepID=A0AAU9LIH9_9ASTR|nr:unnamed protein product [Lactuca virosa]